jgi:hypothetical protein
VSHWDWKKVLQKEHRWDYYLGSHWGTQKESHWDWKKDLQ